MSLWVVLRKELLDTVRDRRTLWAMVLGPVLVMPLFVLLPQKLVQRQMETGQARVIRLAVAGGEAAPRLMAFLAESDEVELIPTEDPESLARSEQAEVGLIVPATFEADLEAGRATRLRLLNDESQMLSGLAAQRVRGLLAAYSQQVVGARLEARGVDPAILVPFLVEDVNLATPQEMGGAFLGMMLPMFIILWALVGGMYTAIDVTAGEKERLTLEPLLTSPARRRDIVLGKLLAVVSTSLVALLLAVGSMFAAFVVAPPTGEELTEGLGSLVGPGTSLQVLLAALPVVVMFSGLEMAVCLMARSFKEAQNYIVPMQFVVLLPAIAVMVMPDLSPSLPTFAIPIFSTLIVLRDLFLGRADPAAFGVMVASSLVYAGIAIALAVWQFGRERVLFRV